MARITIDYSDGRHSFRRVPEDAPVSPSHVEIPDSTLALWEAIADLDHQIQRQLLRLDNELQDRSERDVREVTYSVDEASLVSCTQGPGTVATAAQAPACNAICAGVVDSRRGQARNRP